MDENTLEGLCLQVNHTKYGTLFACMIAGSGRIISKVDEEGQYLPFLSTQEILKQIAKFGFYVKYNEMSNLPGPTLDYIQNIMQLGYQKITRILLQTTSTQGDTTWQNSVIVYKVVPENTDLLGYGMKIGRKKWMEKVDANTVLNVTNEGIDWDWVDCMYNLSDVMDENLDPADPYETDTDVEEGELTPYAPDSYTTYEDSDTEPESNLSPLDAEFVKSNCIICGSQRCPGIPEAADHCQAYQDYINNEVTDNAE